MAAVSSGAQGCSFATLDAQAAAALPRSAHSQPSERSTSEDCIAPKEFAPKPNSNPKGSSQRGRAGAREGEQTARCERGGGGAAGPGRGRGGRLGRVRGQGFALTPARRSQDVFLMIRRHKTTIFTDAKESSTVFELKRIVEGILKRPPDEQRLYKDDQLLDDGKTLGECGFTSQTARPQAPATVGLAFRAEDTFEALCIEPFSSPPELPDVMKPQDSGSSANEQAVQ
nr:elongin-B [Aotus nancymaae]